MLFVSWVPLVVMWAIIMKAHMVITYPECRGNNLRITDAFPFGCILVSIQLCFYFCGIWIVVDSICFRFRRAERKMGLSRRQKLVKVGSFVSINYLLLIFQLKHFWFSRSSGNSFII